MKMDIEIIKSKKPNGATHYDTFWNQYLKVSGNQLFTYLVFDVSNDDFGSFWFLSILNDDVSVVDNNECITL